MRAKTIRAGLADNPDVELIVVKNTNTGLLRYPEIFWKLLHLRLRQKPDVYLVTFRAYELLPFTLLLAGRKPVIYDEFINLLEWMVYEHRKFDARSVPARLIRAVYGWLMRRCALILTDTDAHAELSARLMNVPLQQYHALPVSTDEAVFKPSRKKPASETFEVFYYANMLPLHGIDVVLEAARKLRANDDILFVLVGGKQPVKDAVDAAVRDGAHIEYHDWIPFEKLPEYAARAGVCLGGPFGGTLQAQHVITGKTYQFLAAEVPTIVGETNVSGKFIDKKNTLVVPQGDAVALARAIEWAYNNQSKLPAIAHAGRKLYETEFSNAVIARQLSQLLASLS